MKILRLISFGCFALLAQGQMVSADLPSTRPSDSEVRAATGQCRRGDATLPTGVVGLSDPAALDSRTADLIAETGVRWVRAEFHWSRIQAEKGGYAWGEYDAMVARYNAAGLRILGILTYVPPHLQTSWATVDAEFQKFAAAAVKRYAARGVHHWEIFNEPNLTGYGWLSERDRPQDHVSAYALLLARANVAIRAQDPEGVVVLGGLAGDVPRALSPEATMQRVYALGARDCFDVFAYHPYGYQSRFPAARARVGAILSAGGDDGKPVWFTEYGWTDFRSMDLAVNASAGSNPMIAAFAQREVADAFFWFAARDYSRNPGTPTFGLADYSYRKRGSFETFRRLMEVVN